METKTFIITVRLEKNKNHDPKKKVIGKCPLAQNFGKCTDVTGEHHSFVGFGYDAEGVKEFYGKPPFSYHITRVEECG